MRYALLGLCFASLTACSKYDEVWLIKVGQADSNSTTATCSENLDAAECPESQDPEPDEWTLKAERERSQQTGFLEILNGPAGERYLVRDDLVYVGQKNGGDWVFSWERFDDRSDEQKHESGYVLRTSDSDHVTVAYNLSFKGKTAVGTFTVENTRTGRVEESDSWLFAEVGLERGQLQDNMPDGVTLKGESDNLNDQRDCSGGDVCWVEGAVTTAISLPITLFRTDAGPDDFDGVQDAGQPAG
ncbi:MAG: hypothetical protein ACI9MC_001615 [Kiritimatiellia bacterium]|jgi:hypothetical protein